MTSWCGPNVSAVMSDVFGNKIVLMFFKNQSAEYKI